MRGPLFRTLLALIACIALGYWAFHAPKREEGDQKKKDKLLAFDKAKVKELGLAPAGGEALKVVKQGDVWRLTTPNDVPAATSEVETLLTSLESLEIEEVVAEQPARLADYGLEPPRSTITLAVDGSAPITVLLGEKTPDATAVYAKLGSQARLLAVPAFQAGGLEKKPFDLRDREVLHAQREDVQRLEVSGPEGTYTLVKGAKDDWSFEKPLRTQAGRWSVDSLVGLLANLRMESVAAEDAQDLKPYGLDRPARSLTIGLKQGSRRLEIGSGLPDKKYHAREAGSRMVAVIPGALVDDLAKGMAELRAKRLLEVSTYDVEGLEARFDAQVHTYARSSSKDGDGVEITKWKRTAPDAKDVDTPKVEDALFKLGGLEVQEFVDAPAAPATYGLDAPEIELTLRLQEGRPPVTLALGRKDDAVHARRSGDDAVLKLDAGKVDEALKDLKGL
jgi:hypothetical protein